VDLVEDPERGIRQGAGQQFGAVLGDVPTAVAGRGLRQRLREGGLADLTWAGDEDHLLLEVGFDLAAEVPLGHGRFIPW
jgi:hypothetical protein